MVEQLRTLDSDAVILELYLEKYLAIGLFPKEPTR